MDRQLHRRTVLAAVSGAAAVGLGVGTAGATDHDGVTDLTVNAQSLRGYWAAQRAADPDGGA